MSDELHIGDLVIFVLHFRFACTFITIQSDKQAQIGERIGLLCLAYGCIILYLPPSCYGSLGKLAAQHRTLQLLCIPSGNILPVTKSCYLITPPPLHLLPQQSRVTLKPHGLWLSTGEFGAGTETKATPGSRVTRTRSGRPYPDHRPIQKVRLAGILVTVVGALIVHMVYLCK